MVFVRPLNSQQPPPSRNHAFLKRQAGPNAHLWSMQALQAPRGLGAGDENVAGVSPLEAGALVLEGLHPGEELLERRAADDGVELRPIVADQADPLHVQVIDAPAPRPTAIGDS